MGHKLIFRLILAIHRDAARRFNSEPTERDAVRLFVIGVPVGLALILIAIGNGFGYRPW